MSHRRVTARSFGVAKVAVVYFPRRGFTHPIPVLNMKSSISGVILAGGRGRRLGGYDKGLVMVRGIR